MAKTIRPCQRQMRLVGLATSVAFSLLRPFLICHRRGLGASMWRFHAVQVKPMTRSSLNPQEWATGQGSKGLSPWREFMDVSSTEGSGGDVSIGVPAY